MVNPSTDTIEGITGQFKLAEENFEAALAAYNAADALFQYWEARVMSYMQLNNLQQLNIGGIVYKIVGVRLVKLPANFVYPTATAPLYEP